VTTGAAPARVDGRGDGITRERVVWLASVVFFGVMPVMTLGALFWTAIEGDSIATDFGQYYAAAAAILRGDSPYSPSGDPLTAWGGPYPYPPLLALFAAPLTILSLQAAGLLAMAVLVGVAVAVLWVADVRDWRCYGLALMWPPVISAIQTANVTLWFALAAAIAWRFRDRIWPGAAAIGLTLAAKLFLWPLVVWLAATRRFAAAIATCVVGAGALVVSWAVIGFAGFADYPQLVRKLERTVGEDSYTAYIVGLDAGLPSTAARVVWLGLGVALVAAAAVLGVRGEAKTAFVIAIAASLALTPIVWLHYFALLLVPIALARPTLGALWFVPLGMVLTPGSGHPTPFQTAWTLAIAALALGWAAWLCARDARQLTPAHVPVAAARA
jgi:hypothetical protein